MEIDFLGLSDKRYLSNYVKHDDGVGFGDRGLNKKAGGQWGKSKLYDSSNFMHASDFQEAPGTYRCVSVSATSVLNRGHFGGAFHNVPQLDPLTTHSSLVPRVYSSTSFPQLTIFYGGTVKVFDDISPEKAQAVMLCAGNGLKGETGESSLKKQSVQQVERMYRKQTYNVEAAASSCSATPYESFSKCRDKPIYATNAMSMIESFNAGPASMIPSVPQARKASLARFLEKRKERIMSAMPYKKKMLLDLSTGESSGTNYSSTSPA